MRRLARWLRVLTTAIGFFLRRGWRGEGGPGRLRAFFERLGGTYLELGQMLALQPDRLPRRYCNALFGLLDRVPPFAFEDVERIFRAELGGPPEEVFERFDRRPFASAPTVR